MEAAKAGLRLDQELEKPEAPQVLHESLSGVYKVGIGSARRPIKEPSPDSSDSPRFMNEDVHESAYELVDSKTRAPVPLNQRTNLGRVGQQRGVDLGFGLFRRFYANQYEALCTEREPCCEAFEAEMARARGGGQ
jgi:hypothetical protein